jgi:hypothetical protein
VIEGMDNKKAPVEDGITAEIFKQTFKIFSASITAMYYSCLQNGIFSEIRKKAKITPITKPDIQNSQDVTKYRSISLLNIGGKILEKALLNRINHHICYRISKKEPVRIHPTNEYNRRNYGSKRIRAGRIQ